MTIEKKIDSPQIAFFNFMPEFIVSLLGPLQRAKSSIVDFDRGI